MSTEDFIPQLFCRREDGLQAAKKDKRANPYPGQLVTLAISFTIKGVSLLAQQLEIALPRKNQLDKFWISLTRLTTRLRINHQRIQNPNVKLTERIY